VLSASKCNQRTHRCTGALMIPAILQPSNLVAMMTHASNW
jgi:hypothetical protein